MEIIQNEHGERTTPSYVAFTEKGCLVGNSAYYHAATNPQNTIYCKYHFNLLNRIKCDKKKYILIAVKRLMGRSFSERCVRESIKNFPFSVIEEDGKIHVQVRYRDEIQLYYPEEISAKILEILKENAENYLNHEVKEVVIAVPAYFNDAQRAATKTAAEISGLTPLKIINEPTAAALGYGIRGVTQQKVLVFDFGGGTCDITIMEIANKEFNVIGTNGDSHLGGDDMDQRLVDYFIEEFKDEINVDQNPGLIIQLKRNCEKVKRMLSNSTEETLTLNVNLETTITRAQFEDLCYDLFEKAIKLVQDALIETNLEKTNIDTILLVGGTTRIPKIREMLSEFFDRKPLTHTINPDEAVAIGAAYQAALINEDQSLLRGIKLTDVCPLSLGIQVYDGSLSHMIKRNTPIPVKKVETYTTTEDNQTSVDVLVYEGERFLAMDNHFLGKIPLTGIPRAPRGWVELECSFEIDENGILTVFVIEPTTGNRNQIVIKNENRLSKIEAQKIIDRANELREETKFHKERLSARNELEELLYWTGHYADDYAENMKKQLKINISTIKEWFHDNQNATKEEFLEKKSELQTLLDTYAEQQNE